ncbi:MAG: hypothetical protein ACI9MR_004270 [Myxococcota bacterium]|jgi:hypothetical protein
MGKQYTKEMLASVAPPDVATSTKAGAGMRGAVAGAQGYDAQSQKVAPKGDDKAGPIMTSGGVWSHTTFTKEAFDTSFGKRSGCLIMLKFAPNSSVESEKIGLVQTTMSSKTTKDAAGKDSKKLFYGGDKKREDRSTKKGVNIDRAPGQSSPYFAGGTKGWDAKESEELEGIFAEKNKTFDSKQGTDDVEAMQKNRADASKNSATLSEFGHREGDKKKSASLRDRPGLIWTPGTAIECIFECAAVSLDGPQAGTYYGSVTWGYKVAAAGGAISLIPLKVNQAGVPTKEFMAAGKEWNETDAYSHTRYYDRDKAKGTPYPTNADLLSGLDEKVSFVEKRVRDRRVKKGGDWKEVTIDSVQNEQMPVVDHAKYAEYLPKAKAVKGEAKKLEALEKEIKDVTTWANIEYELSRSK